MNLTRRWLFGLFGGAAAGAVAPRVPSGVTGLADQVASLMPVGVMGLADPVAPGGSFVTFFDQAGKAIASSPVLRVGDSLKLRATGQIPAGMTVAASSMTLDMGEGRTHRTPPRPFPCGGECFASSGTMTVDYDFESSEVLPPGLERYTPPAAYVFVPDPEDAEVEAELGWDRAPEDWDDDDDRWRYDD